MDIARHIDATAATPDGLLVLDSKVLLVQLPEHCNDKEVADALQEVVQQLLPRLNCSMTQDVQVMTADGARCCAGGLCVGCVEKAAEFS